ncbi:MAG: histidine phosphatase family protein [Haloferacaceae archaeon]
MPTVLLARHGETTWNREGRLQGWAPTPLTDRGHDQAEGLAVAVDEHYDVDRVYASDLRRARETAEYVARRGHDVTYESSWRERDVGRYQGLYKEEFYEMRPEYSLERTGRDAFDARPESGESLRDVRERVRSGWRDLHESLGGDETALVVAHGGPLQLLVGDVAGRDPVSSVLEGEQENCALNELAVENGESRVVAENRTEFL